MSGEGEHSCRLGWLVEDIGRFLAGVDVDAGAGAGVDREAVVQAGREAVHQGARQVDELLQSAFASHEIVASELRLSGRTRGARRTVFGDEPSPVALLLLCLRLCDDGDEVALLHHTAGQGTTTRSAIWPFGMDRAEELTRPPSAGRAPLPGFEGFPTQ